MGPKVMTEAWACVNSRTGKPSDVETQQDPSLSTTLTEIGKKWTFKQPDAEASIMTAKGEIVYIGRYAEGVVLRLREDSHQTVFLTKAMAEKLAQKLLGKT
jgi:hypothetical protein